ncbi:hypothetical protein EDD86DRAFT_216368 [Gorgonomyces haynaldii]|nr:hypothetical protein EDD86DRAFT_216368 [Gorgonomyces haynaldii]
MRQEHWQSLKDIQVHDPWYCRPKILFQMLQDCRYLEKLWITVHLNIDFDKLVPWLPKTLKSLYIDCQKASKRGLRELPALKHLGLSICAIDTRDLSCINFDQMESFELRDMQLDPLVLQNVLKTTRIKHLSLLPTNHLSIDLSFMSQLSFLELDLSSPVELLGLRTLDLVTLKIEHSDLLSHPKAGSFLIHYILDKQPRYIIGIPSETNALEEFLLESLSELESMSLLGPIAMPSLPVRTLPQNIVDCQLLRRKVSRHFPWLFGLSPHQIHEKLERLELDRYSHCDSFDSIHSVFSDL